nr:transglutaminase-like domain-containing protein [Xanthomonas sp. NCPPB 1067]
MRNWIIFLLCAGLSLPPLGSRAVEASKPIKVSEAKPVQNSDLTVIKTLVATPEEQIDLATAKLTIDSVIDPTVDAKAALAQLDSLASRVKSRFPNDATRQIKLELLVTSLSQPGPWNDYQPFSYDLDDPFGKDIRNKLISTYLTTRKGNCVSMPILLVILGQKLGLRKL